MVAKKGKKKRTLNEEEIKKLIELIWLYEGAGFHPKNAIEMINMNADLGYEKLSKEDLDNGKAPEPIKIKRTTYYKYRKAVYENKESIDNEIYVFQYQYKQKIVELLKMANAIHQQQQKNLIMIKNPEKSQKICESILKNLQILSNFWSTLNKMSKNSAFTDFTEERHLALEDKRKKELDTKEDELE